MNTLKLDNENQPNLIFGKSSDPNIRQKITRIARFYNNYYTVWLTEAVIKIVTKKSPQCILDLGCGDGRFSILAASKRDNVHIIGVDVFRLQIRKALQRAKMEDLRQKLSFVVCDAEHLPFRYDVFDAVAIINVLHHLKSIFTVLKQVNKVLKIGKYMLIIEHPMNNPFLFIGRKMSKFVPEFIRKRNCLGNFNMFTVNRLRNELKRMNFIIIEEKRYELFMFLLPDFIKIFPMFHRYLSKRLLILLYRLERALLVHHLAIFCGQVLFFCIRAS